MRRKVGRRSARCERCEVVEDDDGDAVVVGGGGTTLRNGGPEVLDKPDPILDALNDVVVHERQFRCKCLVQRVLPIELEAVVGEGCTSSAPGGKGCEYNGYRRPFG